MWTVAEKECRWCGKVFTPNSPNGKYCSDRCREGAENFKRSIDRTVFVTKRSKLMTEISKKSTIDKTLAEKPEGMSYGYYRAIKSGFLPQVDLKGVKR